MLRVIKAGRKREKQKRVVSCIISVDQAIQFSHACREVYVFVPSSDWLDDLLE